MGFGGNVMYLTTEVILCTYNGSAFIIEQLESILKQTTRVNKISIYDDQSSDDTVPRIHGFISRQAEDIQRLFNIQINRVNLGYARNFTEAMARSTKDVLFLCDQDDIWEPGKVEAFLDLLILHGSDMVFSDGEIIDHSGLALGRGTVFKSYGLTKNSVSCFRERGFELLMKRNYINGAATAVRRIAAQNALPLPCDMPHDYWIAIWCSLHNGIVATPQILYRYRQHQGNVVGIGSSKLLYDLLGIWRHPSAPRKRELRIWKAVAGRIASVCRPDQCEAATRKLEWLSRVVTGDSKSSARSYEILKSAFNGSYRKYSPRYAFLRDLVSLFKS
jgi:glycosyltransferase involved in cell wall biosynthesis